MEKATCRILFDDTKNFSIISSKKGKNHFSTYVHQKLWSAKARSYNNIFISGRGSEEGIKLARKLWGMTEPTST